MNKFTKSRIKIFFAFLILGSGLSLVQGQVISGRLTTAAYNWQQRESDSTSATHLRMYQLAQINIGQIGLPNLTFHTYLSLASDVMEDANDDPRFWLYNCYFNWRNIGKALDLSVGRQRIFGGVSYGTYDGVQLKYQQKDNFQILLYAGALVSRTNSKQNDKFDLDKLSWGLHLTTRKIKKTYLGLSFAQKSQIPVQYSAEGIYTGAYRLEHPLTILQQQLLGVDFSTDLIPKFHMTGRLDFTIQTEEVKRSEVTGKYEIIQNLDVGVEYIYRHPTLFENSIFSVFPSESNQEFGLLAGWRFKKAYLNFNLSQVAFENENAQRIRFGCSWKNYYLGYFHRGGYSGDSDGFSFNVNYPIQNRVNLTFGSTFNSYKLTGSMSEKEQALAGVLGVNYQPIQALNLQLNAQFLRNTYFERDIRFQFRGSYAFLQKF